MRYAAGILAMLFAIAGIGYYFSAVSPIQDHMKLGLDLRGGVQVVLQAVDSPELGEVTADRVEAAKQVIERRVNASGLNEPSIASDRNNRIIVQLAGETDPDRARSLLGTTAVLTFLDPNGDEVITGADIASASVFGSGAGDIGVELKLKGEGPRKFEEATTVWIGSPIVIILDDEVISAPVVRGPIPGGTATITGGFTLEEAKNLADLLNGGALPVKLEMIEVRVVSATLGMDSLYKSARAGVIGLVAVVLFMLVVYRIPGFLATIALALYVILTIGFLIAIDAVFTLPGLAAVLLAIGMAIDGNIIIFERIRDELRQGKGLRSAIDAGFHRAFAAILDGQLTTALAGVVLYFLGTGPVKGFAITLIVGVLISLFTAVTFSRWLIKLTVNTGWFDRRLFGVKEVSR